jgi:hypothetical protein
MVVRINSSKSILRALNYNEQKVTTGDARCLLAHHFLKDKQSLNFYEKLRHFQSYQVLNERTKTNTLHISLNFDPSEKLSSDTLVQIAQNYMQGIGFDKQPYLVYQHFDSGHPHLHIVSTNVQFDGERISLHNLGRDLSERARKQIEIDFCLVRAEGRKKEVGDHLSPGTRVINGTMETKKAMARVLQKVLKTYLYTSIPELNAVLKPYNVVADRGTTESRIFQTGGLVYRVLDGKGEKVGTPVKASAFSFKPTLSFLEEQFKKNASVRIPHAQRLRTRIDFALSKKRDKLFFQKALEKEGIMVLWRENKEYTYGVTYIDHHTKSVFNGSDLGKNYSAQKILERCDNANTKQIPQTKELQQRITYEKETSIDTKIPIGSTIIEELVSPEHTFSYVPFGLKKKKRRKNKKL